MTAPAADRLAAFDPDDPNTMWGNQACADVDLGTLLATVGCGRSAEQLGMLEAFRAFYAECGVLPGNGNPPLQRCCQSGQACWGPIPPEHRPSSDLGGISLPWIGSEYHRTRVAVMAHNLKEASGLLAEHKVAYDTRRAFESGSPGPYPSRFQRHTAKAVAAVLAAQCGELPDSDPEPPELVSVLDAFARIQAVKCSPLDAGDSKPSPAMHANCPVLYLRAELELLSPRWLLVLGVPAHQAVQMLFPDEPGNEWNGPPALTRRDIELRDGPCHVFCVYHPSHAWWYRSWPLLTQVLSTPAR